MTNKEQRGATLHAYLSYHDAPAAMRWLERAFGFETTMEVYIGVDDSEAVDAVFASAVAAGAVVVWTPEMSEWGNYRCRVRDLEGDEWTFGSHRPGQPVSGWEHSRKRQPATRPSTSWVGPGSSSSAR